MSSFRVTNFSELKKLFKGQKINKEIREIKITTKPKPKVSMLTIDNEVKVVSSSIKELVSLHLQINKSSSLNEVAKALSVYNFGLDDLLAALQSLSVDGVVSIDTYSVNGKIDNIYTYRGEVSSGNKPRTFKLPENINHINKDPDMIQTTDDLDTAIFKVMKDRQERTLDQIGGVLFEMGYNLLQAKDRVVTLQKRKIFFDRLEKHNGIYLRLKKHVKTFNKENVIESIEPPSMLTDLTREFTPPTPPVTKGTKTTSDIVTKTGVSSVKPFNYDPNKGSKLDHILVYVWHVMQDRQWYSSNDIFILLQDHGVNLQRVYSVMNIAMDRLEWFEVKKQKQTNDKTVTRPINHYRLKESKLPENLEILSKHLVFETIDKPIADTFTLPNKISPVIKEPIVKDKDVLLRKAPIITSGNNETDNLVSALKLKQLTEDTPLVQVSFKIKEIDFTMSEVEQLYKEIVQLGIKGSNDYPTTTLIQRSTIIKGVNFTDSDLLSIIDSLDSIFN